MDAARAAFQNAIGNGDVLANAAGIGDAGECQRIIAAADDAVGHHDVFRAAKMDAVVVRNLEIVINPDSVNLDVLAATKRDRPARGVFDGHAFKPEMVAVMKKIGWLGRSSAVTTHCLRCQS